ncbi:hypothetical protein KJ359_000442 [Pestalotiopsis sp. 9143b]|nr:hypothetical protein KJ359_000442 [Pestalotiopsis sp. 9143b]
MDSYPTKGVLVEAEAFDHYGGWLLDSQFELQMGSPYLLAHGNGTPVADATTSVDIHHSASYKVWVRAKDWMPKHHPGRFTLTINDITLETEFGAHGQDWSWQYGGTVDLSAGQTQLALHDLTGFGGRCDAIFLGLEDSAPPNAVNEPSRAWRRACRGLPAEPLDVGSFNVVVVGGGVSGIAAALTAARLGDRVALVQNRPYLGGNASMEIGLSPRGVKGPLVDEISQRTSTGDLVALELLRAEPTATIFMEHNVYNATTLNSKINSIDAREAHSGREIRLRASNFIDASGTAVLGILTGAETLFGQESKSEYNEQLAPESRNSMHHGNTVFFRTRMRESPISFPHVPWALEVAKDFSDLSGQLVEPGTENGPGPQVASENSSWEAPVPRRMQGPLTHFWEYGQWLDPYTEAEHIRDHLLCAIYGTFANVKRMEPDTYANLELEWVAHVPAQGEFRRYRGDYVLSENDIRAHKSFYDAVAQNGGAFCLHYPGNEKYDFRLKDWRWDERDGEAYDVPLRSLYSVDISNLLMAGKHISVTRIAGSNTKFMGNGAQHGIATAAAAHLCKKYAASPRELLRTRIPELQALVSRFTQRDRASRL